LTKSMERCKMDYDQVFSEDPAIVVTEVEMDNNLDDYLSIFHIYLDGEHVGTAHSRAEAREIANEVFASVTGEPQEEDGEGQDD